MDHMDRHADGTLNPDTLAARIAKRAHQQGVYATALWARKRGIRPAFINRAILGRG